ncbi:divisome protein SepX/GlpR [Streptomyces sp. WMMC1477]|uniref:divisome protein SepX/GlpR n=1 Tax=Streptomyces sp. WMMC1477 TaxID=3015155 RepID=UPI0022B6545D|nr:gephyrin-like molybdotransferase receptor GlpR [Streptomyces sp. WMMC1477]MCZ7431688.1 hypothetical protein [Streptomyces sp. WMMC1477]
MSSSGLIYAVIVGAWAAYLVPMWLRRQDELNDARPTERFSTAIRALTGRMSTGRRQAKDGDDEQPEQPAHERPDGTPDAIRRFTDPAGARGPEPHAGPSPHAAPDPGPPAHAATSAPAPGAPDAGAQEPAAPRSALTPEERAARAKLLGRRRRTTMVLFLALTLGSVAAAVGGTQFLWAPALPAALLTACVLYVRGQERRRHAARLAGARPDQQQAEAAARRLRERRHAAVAATPPPPAATEPRAGSTPTDDRRALVEETDHAEWVDQQRTPRALHDPDGWEPVPVPLPTYVNAPVAPRHASGVDLGAPDTWSSARSEPPVAPAAPAASTDDRRRGRTPLFDQYADQDHPRAANE